MKLTMRAKAFSKKFTLITTAFVLSISSLTAVAPFVLSQSVSAQQGADTVTVTGNTTSQENTKGWIFNRDAGNATPIQFVGGTSSVGAGSLYVEPLSDTVAAKKFIGENFIFTKMSDLSTISVDYKLGPATSATQVYMNVYANYGSSADNNYYDCRYDVVAMGGSVSNFSTLTFDPNESHTVTTRSGSAACPAKPAAMGEHAKVRAYGINLGGTSLSDAGMSAYFDKSVVTTMAGSVVYDFEPLPPVAPDSVRINKNGTAVASGSVVNGSFVNGNIAVDFKAADNAHRYITRVSAPDQIGRAHV